MTSTISSSAKGDRASGRLPRRLVAAVVPGTLLNPLNSSMIAVALLSLRHDFRVSTATATWLVSGFYLAGAIGMPLMGRLADQFGARRIFCLGLLLVGVTGSLAPLCPSFSWLLADRIAQAFGSSAGFPAALAIFRAWDPRGQTPAQALGAVSIASSVSAALGPVIGGFLVAAAGWQAIFLVNVPVIVVGLVLALRWMPAPKATRPATTGPAPWAGVRTVLGMVDLPGVALFSGMLACLLGFLLSLSGNALWPLLPLAIVAAALLALRELGAAMPFLDVRMLAANRPLVGVYAQFAAVNVVFYGVFFGLPLWLQQARGYDPGLAGLLLLPVAGVGVLTTPVAARLITRSGPRSSLIIGATALLVGCLSLLLIGTTTPLIALVAVGAVLGVPNGFNNLGLQAALYEDVPPEKMGAAGGLFQTSRYTGAILSTAALGLIFGTTASTGDLHTLASVLAVISAVLLAASVAVRRPSRKG